MASLGLCLCSLAFLNRTCPTSHGGGGGPCVHSRFSIGIWMPLHELGALLLGIGVLCFHTVPLQAVLSCLSSACSCLLTDRYCRWTAWAATPCALRHRFPLYNCRRGAAAMCAGHVLPSDTEGTVIPAPVFFHASLSLADTSGGGTRRPA